MKKQILISSFSVILLIASVQAYSQQHKFSDKGFWVIESNVKTPNTHLVCFYNNNKELIYKEHIEGVRLNLKKKKVRLRLNSLLDRAIEASLSKTLAKENDSLVATAFKNLRE